MIKEAADIILKLKEILDAIRSGALNVMDGQLRISNSYWVNGITKTVEIARTEEAFVIAANILICGGDVMTFALKNEDDRERDYRAALAALRIYSKALESARLRPDAVDMGTADGTEVGAPII